MLGVFPRPPIRITSACFLPLLLAVLPLLAGCAVLEPPAHEVTQISTYPALQIGLYDGDVTYAQLAKMGDLGIGTSTAWTAR